jgi:hypothetical protein
MKLMESKRQEGKTTSEKILEKIHTYSKSNGYPPSIRELAEMTGLKSTSTVHGHLKRLERKGKISRGVEMPRAIKVLKVKQKEIKIEIIETLGTLSEPSSDHVEQLNSVRWDDKEIRFDIRSFAADNECVGEGITLTINGMKRLWAVMNDSGLFL